MSDWLENTKATLVFLIENPVVLGVAIAVALLFYWIQSRLERRARKAQSNDSLAGWKSGPRTASRQDVLTLKPTGHVLKVAIITLVFFGGGAVFFAMVVLPDPVERTFENLMAFVIMCVFSAVALFLFAAYFTRFDVKDDEIVHRRLLRKRQRYPLNTLAAVKPAGKNPALGIKLAFEDGRELKLWARFLGYSEMLSKLPPVHPEFRSYQVLGRMAQKVMMRSKGA